MKTITLSQEEYDDIQDRLNELELQIIEAKEFSHLSSDALQTFTKQMEEFFATVDKIDVIPQPSQDPSLSSATIDTPSLYL